MKVLVTFAVRLRIRALAEIASFCAARAAGFFPLQFGEVRSAGCLHRRGREEARGSISPETFGADPSTFASRPGSRARCESRYRVGEIVAPRAVANTYRLARDSLAIANWLTWRGVAAREAVPLLLTVDHVVWKAAEKQELGESGDVVDMESCRSAHAGSCAGRCV